MDDVSKVLGSLQDLCNSIRQFKEEYIDQATFSSPIIDHFHPDDYDQRGITGLNKFLGHAETERDYVKGLVESQRPPNDLPTTNAPNLLAIWDEFIRSPWPICSIAQHVDCGAEGQVKVDVVAEGGNLWVKVNTMKEYRLMAEFREQDSYINSDYDSDSLDSSSSHSPSTANRLTNSLVVQAESLLRAAKAHVRPLGLPTPRVRFVLNRLERNPEKGYADDRIPRTFQTLSDLGVELVLGSQPPSNPPPRPRLPSLPTKRIMLDLSVIVALCCDSTHRPLPRNRDELEARFRPSQKKEDGMIGLADHTIVSKDLRDQLSLEMQHPVIEEIQSRLAGYGADEIEWYVTREVKERTPGIVTLIGGPQEQARAKALYGESDSSFWTGSRYEGKEGILAGLKVKVLGVHAEEGLTRMGINERSMFEKGLISVCERMLSAVEAGPQSATSTPPTAPQVKPTGRHRKGRGIKFKRNPNLPPPQRLPSTHTLRTLLLGVKGGMTVLTNNRGAVGKIIREMGVTEGLPFDPEEQVVSGEVRKAVAWVVNPSSLSEWRRVEVERINAEIAPNGA